MRMKPILHVVALRVVLVGAPPVARAREARAGHRRRRRRRVPPTSWSPARRSRSRSICRRMCLSAFTALTRVLDAAGRALRARGPGDGSGGAADRPVARAGRTPCDARRPPRRRRARSHRQGRAALPLDGSRWRHRRAVDRGRCRHPRSRSRAVHVDECVAARRARRAHVRGDRSVASAEAGIAASGGPAGTGAGVDGDAHRPQRDDVVTGRDGADHPDRHLAGERRVVVDVKYDRAPAAPDTASITFTERGVEMTALSPYAQRTQSVPGLLPANRLPMSSAVTTMIAVYADRAGLRVSIEEAAARPGEQPSSPTQTVAACRRWSCRISPAPPSPASSRSTRGTSSRRRTGSYLRAAQTGRARPVRAARSDGRRFLGHE